MCGREKGNRPHMHLLKFADIRQLGIIKTRQTLNASIDHRNFPPGRV